MVKTKQKQVDIINPKKEKIISWFAPEFIYAPKNTAWYFFMILIMAILIGLFYWMKNYYAIGVVVLVPIIFYLLSRGKVKKIKYILGAGGINFNDKFHDFNSFKSFWIVSKPEADILYLESTQKMSPPITIYLTKINIKEVYDFIKQRLPENKEKKETFYDQVFRILRF
ncbi:MAG: hypothetical protein M1338_02725 [Patescibacteria group bacterium]|nr:hypothetical protein [Patescibacteria group bacterium]